MAEVWRIKVCLVGESGVGKTSLVRRYVLDQFDDGYITTIGTKVTKKEMHLKSPRTGGEATIVVFIFDIMGSHVLRELLLETYFTGAEGILGVCDVSRPETLPALKVWRTAVEGVAGRVPMVILGNKADLTGQAGLTQEQLETAAAEFGCPAFLTSARTGQNVEAAFMALVVSIVKGAASRRAAPETAGEKEVPAGER